MLSKVYARGQIVIPAAMRRKYSIEPGDGVELKEGKDCIIIYLQKEKLSLMDLAGCIVSDKPFPTKQVVRKIVREALVEEYEAGR